jgi:hypothetical protein
MSDYDTDIDDISFNDEMGSEADTYGEHGGSASATDAVADLLLGDDSTLKNAASKNDSGERSAGDKSFIVRRDDDAEKPASRSEGVEYGKTMPEDTSQEYYNAQQTVQNCNQTFADINEQFNRGELTAEQANFMHQQNAQQFFQAQHAMDNTRIQMLERENFMRNAHSVMEQTMGDDWKDPVKREELGKKGADYLRQQGFSHEEIAELDDPRAATVLLKSIQAQEDNKRLKLELSAAKQKLRNHNRGLREAQKHSGRGSPQKSQNATDAIADLLIKNKSVR